ncbi:glycosyltransferase family 2 protein [Seonamhaeicola sediminis]|uniref:Glycosyltransferase family 2 protein n=1 Tax=Seonamhaeicola sediminis TaxID=2528206 RepID=A0A562YBZ2_9FLAO|nr:glycosyltransferase family 2 protein [Seonamhaeicola sediminis]TWO31798.1 glycosyltransferase family 2 protein [Seonamhaeicola sediminis]
MQPFFSIVIPLYNKEKYIQDTLKSVLNQTFKEFEVIIVNDGCTDSSLDIVKTYNNKRIIISNQKNKGVSAARNKGIELSKAKFIAFLDADDIWLPNHLSTLKTLIEDFPECGMYCSRYKTRISPKKIINNDLSKHIKEDYRGVIPDFFQASLINRVAHTSAVVIPKRILENDGMFDLNISSGQDLDLWIRVAAHYNVAITNKKTSIYRFEIPNSLSKTPFLSKKLIDFKKFESLEENNKSLKHFLDLYRLEYALHYRIYGAVQQSKKLLNQINTKIPFTTKVLLKLPPFLLKMLLGTKHLLKSKGIDFTVYH